MPAARHFFGIDNYLVATRERPRKAVPEQPELRQRRLGGNFFTTPSYVFLIGKSGLAAPPEHGQGLGQKPRLLAWGQLCPHGMPGEESGLSRLRLGDYFMSRGPCLSFDLQCIGFGRTLLADRRRLDRKSVV